VETIDYFLRRYREEVIQKRKAAQDIEARSWQIWHGSFASSLRRSPRGWPRTENDLDHGISLE